MSVRTISRCVVLVKSELNACMVAVKAKTLSGGFYAVTSSNIVLAGIPVSSTRILFILIIKFSIWRRWASQKHLI